MWEMWQQHPTRDATSMPLEVHLPETTYNGTTQVPRKAGSAASWSNSECRDSYATQQQQRQVQFAQGHPEGYVQAHQEMQPIGGNLPPTMLRAPTEDRKPPPVAIAPNPPSIQVAVAPNHPEGPEPTWGAIYQRK